MVLNSASRGSTPRVDGGNCLAKEIGRPSLDFFVEVVQSSYFYVKEFRLAESSQDILRYHISLGPAHTILAQACLGVLLRLDDSIDCDSIESYPLAR
jgi:hypothetical protein